MNTKKLRQKILDLAIHGKLVPQDPNDEPASVLLERIRAEKERLIAEGKIKRSKKSATSDTSHYENVPFEVPEGWSWCTLDELTTSIGDGLHGTPKFDDNGEYYFVNGNNLDGIISIKKETKRTTIDEYTKQGLKFNSQTIFVSINGTLGNIAFYNNEPIVLGKSACYINLLDGISKEYIATILRCQYFLNYCRDTATGSTIKNVPLAAMRAFFIPIPSYQEQLRIVDEVEKLLSLVDLLDENTNELGNAITVARSKILDLAIHGKLVPQDANDEPASELLKRINPKAIASCDNPHYAESYDLPNGWTWCKLINICTFLSRGKSPKYSETDTTYPVFAQKCNLKEGGISLEKAQFLEPTTLNRWPDVYHLQTGDVLVNSTGTGTVGRTRLFNESCLGNYPFVVPDSHVSVIRTHGEIVSKYIFALMSSSWIQTYLEDNLAGSTNQKELYIGVLQNVDVPLPPVMEQTRIADKIESLYQQLDNIANHIE